VLFPLAAAEKSRRRPRRINQTHHPVCAASSYAPLHLQQSIPSASVTKIHVRYQSVILRAEIVVNLAAFAMLVLYSSLRYAAPAHPNKSVPAMPKCKSGTGFLAAEMKEYDA